jgi:hypothetical protein
LPHPAATAPLSNNQTPTLPLSPGFPRRRCKISFADRLAPLLSSLQVQPRKLDTQARQRHANILCASLAETATAGRARGTKMLRQNAKRPSPQLRHIRRTSAKNSPHNDEQMQLIALHKSKCRRQEVMSIAKDWHAKGRKPTLHSGRMLGKSWGSSGILRRVRTNGLLLAGVLRQGV